MARTPRSHLPGAIFHLTARTQGRAPWLTERVRWRVLEYLASALEASDAQLLSYAIMPNHLHLIIRQGHWPLGRVMQPLLRRVALLVQREQGMAGHVFERRFRDHACLSPDHARNAIVYTHLNPVRAGLAERPGAYVWSSHSLYAGGYGQPPGMKEVVAVRAGLGLFAPHGDMTMAELRRAYVQHVGWRMQRDDAARDDSLAGRLAAPATSSARVPVGTGWPVAYPPLFRALDGRYRDDGRPRRRARSDLADIARSTVAELGPGLDMERVRSNEKSRSIVRIRREVVRRLKESGYSGRAIARYLRVSDQCVSNCPKARPYDG